MNKLDWKQKNERANIEYVVFFSFTIYIMLIETEHQETLQFLKNSKI